MRRTLIVVCLLIVSTLTLAQKASIKKVELAGEKVIVHYDLEDSNPGNEYQIQLFSSQSNFATPLTKVSGDVGNEIKPGNDKKIEWLLREEIGPYKGRLALEIRGRMFVPVARINSIRAGDSFKRGKSYLINWKAGNTNPVNIELLKDGKPISTDLNQANTGAYTLLIPAHSKVGKDYVVRITDTRNHEDFTVSQNFEVKRKLPLLLKVLPVVAAGGVVLLLSNPDEDDGIPDPPHPD